MSNKIVCQVCKKKFKMLTNSHLNSHNIKSAAEYRKMFPGQPTTAPSLRKKYSERSQKSNESRKGISRPQSVKDAISEKNTGNVAWNKGLKMSEEYNEEVVRPAVERREKRYRSGELKRHQTVMTPEISKKISNTLSERNKPLTEARKEYKLKKKKLNQVGRRFEKYYRFFQNAEKSNVIVLGSWLDHLILLECKKCQNLFYRTIQAFQDSKVRSDLCDICRSTPKHSKQELEILKFVRKCLPDVFVKCGDRTQIKSLYSKGWKLELDVYIPSMNLAFEYDGLYTHSDEFKDSDYHLMKRKLCDEKGIRLIQIFEDEYLHKKEIVLSRIKNILGITERRIYARKCDIKEITSKEANRFLSENHIQGSGRSNVRYGLYYKDELVSVMTFSKSNISRKIKDWEINRFCSKLDYNIIGGASKLFKKFILDYNPKEVISYADRRWSNGELYKNLGFEFVHNSSINFWYVNGSKRLSRYALRKDVLVKKGFDSKLTAEQIIEKLKIRKIYDCGSSKWVWKAK